MNMICYVPLFLLAHITLNLNKFLLSLKKKIIIIINLGFIYVQIGKHTFSIEDSNLIDIFLSS